MLPTRKISKPFFEPGLPELLSESPLGQVFRAGRRAPDPAEAWVLHTHEDSVVAIDRLRL